MSAETKKMSVCAVEKNRTILRRQWGANLDELLRQRFVHLRAHLTPGSRVLELGAGGGESRRHLPGIDLVQTDIEANPWLDAAISAESLPFADNSFDAIVALNVFHHLAMPRHALAECQRVVRPGGKIVVWESHASWLLQLLLSARGHEYIDHTVDPYGDKTCQRSDDNWDGNNAIADLFFGNRERLEKAFPALRLVHHRYVECLVFVNSGAVNHRAPYVPLPRFMVRLMMGLDRILCALAPNVFALGQELIFVRKSS